MVHHTNQDKLNMVLVYGECHQNASEAVRCYRARFPDRPTPDRKSFVALCTNLATYSSFKKGKVPRRKRVTTDENVALVLQTVENNPQTSLQKLKDETNITVSSCRRILKGNRFFPYKIHLVHHLQPEDYQRRLNFLAHFHILLEENPNLLNQIMWSDESRFHNNGVINRHNCRYWSRENPNWMRQTKFQTRFGVNVWCGIVNGYIIGPYLYHEHLTSVRYLQFLQNDLPLLLQNVGIDVNTMWFHQDGAPAHNSNIVMNHLNVTFPGKVISTNGDLRWPARSPDLTPMDFYLWGYLQNEIYKEPIEDMADLYNKIYATIAAINRNTLLRVCRTILLYRFAMCVYENGNNFEHLIRPH